MKKLSVSLAVLVSILTSCSIEKRLYTTGYHVEWNNSRLNTIEKKVEHQQTSIETASVNDAAENNLIETESNQNTIVASNNESIIVCQPKKIDFNKKSIQPSIKENNTTTIAKITNVKAETKVKR